MADKGTADADPRIPHAKVIKGRRKIEMARRRRKGGGHRKEDRDGGGGGGGG